MKRLLSRLLPGWLPFSRSRDRDSPEQLARESVRLYERGRYREARLVAARLVDVQRDKLGETHPDFASALGNLGLLLQLQGELDAAEPLLRQVLEIRRQSFGEGNPHFASSLNHLADLLQLRGDLSAAEPLLRQALEIRKQALGEHHPDYATGLTGLALLLATRGQLSDAEPLLHQALAIRKESLGEHHPMTATAVSNLGLLLQRRGDISGAETLLRRALELRREALGVQHPDYAASLSHLASLLIAKNNSAGAEPLLRRAIEVRKAALGEQHPAVQADIKAIAAIRRASDPGPPQGAPKVLLETEGVPLLSATDSPMENVTLPHSNAIPGGMRDYAPLPDDSRSYPAPSEVERGHSRPSEAIKVDLCTLATTFASIGDDLVEAGRLMRSPGLVPELSLLEELQRSERVFTSLRAEVFTRANSLGLSSQTGIQGVTELISLMDLVTKTEDDRAIRGEVLQKAASLLDRALTLRHIDPAYAPLLAPCLHAAEALRTEVQVATPLEEPRCALTGLADGTNPVALLVHFVGEGPGLADTEWAGLYRDVAKAYGTTLAAAAARKRLVFSDVGVRNAGTTGAPAPIPLEQVRAIPIPSEALDEASDSGLRCCPVTSDDGSSPKAHSRNHAGI